MSTPTTIRRYHLDWMRVLAILVVFVYHSGRFFNLEDWHVKSAQTYLGVEVLLAFLGSWGMPFIFVVSGASTFYAIGRRGRGEFVKDRALRLVVPLVVGIFTHIVLQVYLDRVTHGKFHGSFWEFLPHYFDGLEGFGGNFAWTGMHLWYLEMLFIFSLLFLPLLWWLRRGSGARLLKRLSARLAWPGGIYLLALPLMLVAIMLDPTTVLGSRNWGGWSIVMQSLFFLYGFVLVSDEALEVTIQRVRWVSLAVGVAAFLTIGLLVAIAGGIDFSTSRDPLFFGLSGLNAWCWITAVWGFGRKHFKAGTPLLWYANEAVLPFYILHQTVLLGVGYFVVRWPIPDMLKWAAIAVTSFAIFVGLYALLVRRINVLRVLFGMKPLPRVTQPVVAPSWPQMAKE